MKPNFKRIMAMFLTVLMIVGVFPMSIFAAEASPMAAAADWHIKDGQLTVDDVFNKAGGGINAYRYSLDGGATKSDATGLNYTKLDWSGYDGREVILYKRSGIINAKYNEIARYIIQVYHVITVDVTNEEVPSGAGIEINGAIYHDGATLDVDYNTLITFKGVAVDGYSIEYIGGISSPVTASGTLSITYEANVAYDVTVNEQDVNGNSLDGGSVQVTPNPVGAGENLTIEVTPYTGNGYAYYVEGIKVGNNALSVTYANGVATAILSNVTTAPDVTVTYGTRTLNPIAIPEGKDYHVASINGHNKDTILNGLKNNIISAVLGNVDNISQYTVEIYVDLGVWKGWVNPEDASILNTVSDWLTRLNLDFWLEVPGREEIRITWAGSDKLPTVVWEGHVDIADSRQPAKVSLGSFEKKQNKLADFETAILNAINVTNSAGTNIKSNAGLTITLNPVEGKVNTYTISYNVANSGETWLATSGTFAGEVVWEVNVYNVTFKNDDGSVLSKTEYAYGTTADKIVAPTAPTKANEVDANGNIIARYTFAGWTPTVNTVTGEATYTATYNRVVEKYTITWVNGDKTTTETYEYGATPVAPTASKTSTAQYHFTNGTWGTIATVTGDATYTATFTEELRSYTVTFKDYNGNEIDEQTVYYGSAATAPADPTRAADKTYTYTFTGWDKAFNNITGELTVTATYSKTYIDYEVKWVVDGTATIDKYHYNDTIVVPANPTKDNHYFLGWDVNGDGKYTEGETVPAKVTENITITAVFAAKPVYDVVVKYNNGKLDSNYTVIEGNTTTVPAAPAKTGYTFDGWYVNDEKTDAGATITITGNTTIEAKWTINQYTITFVDWNNNVIATLKQDYNTAVTAPANPSRTGYTFKGWDTTVPSKMPAKDMTIKATYEINKYTITWVTGSGTTTETYEYGQTPSFKGSTAKPATAQYTYTFTGWDKAFATVTADATYTAQYSSTVNKYIVIFKNWDGSVLSEKTYDYGTEASAIVVPANPARPVTDDIKYTFTGWGTIATVTGDVTYTAQYSGELNASNGTVAINGYYESKQDKNVFDTLKADVLKAAGLTGNASDYTVEMIYTLGTLNLDKMTGTLEFLNREAFFLAVEIPESRQFTITHSSGASKTVTHKIVDSRPSAGLVNKEFTDVKVLDKNDNPTDYINTLLAQVNPNGLNVTVTLTEGTWPPATAGETYKYVYTVSYESDANWIGGSATLTVYMQSLLNNCTVVPGSSLTAGGSLTVNGSNDNKTVAGNSTVFITVKPSGSNVVETITVYKNGVALATFNTNQISYSSKNATVSFNTDGTEIADVYTVEATYSQNYLNLKSGTIVYCMDNDDLTNAELKALVFGGIFDGSSAPMNAGNVTLEYAYIGVGGYNLWQDISKGPAINLGSLTHKFGEDGTETIRIKYSDDKYGSFEQTVVLNVFDSCYSSTVAIQTIAPEGTEYNFSVKYSADSRTFQGVSYFKQGDPLTVTLTPSGDDIGAILEQLYNKTYSETAPYIKDVKVYKNVDGQWVEVASTLERGNGELVDWDNILGGIGNPFAYTAAVTFTPEADTQYKVVAEYDVLKLERYELSAQMPMYQAGKGYEAEVPSAQEIVDKILGKDYAANFIATHGGAWTVEFSTDIAQSTWTVVTDEALLALYDGTTVRIRITWNPTDDNKTYYPVAVQADLTLVDLRAATNVQGSVPTEKVEYVEESQLIANLKAAMGLGILSNGALIDVEYDVNYTIRVVEAEGNFATVVVTYHGSENYKPCQRTFENVPVADIPDNATIKVTISGAAVNVTNNAGAAQNWDPSTELYTVIGNGTYVFTLTPAEGKAIEAVTVNGEKLEAVIGAGKATQLFYNDGVATFSLYLEEKEHYEIEVKTVDSAWVLEDEPTYDFAYGVQTPVAGDIVEQITKYPTDIDFSKVVLEYLARTEGSVTITLPEIDLGFTAIDLGTFDVDLGELWVPVDAEVTEYDLEKLVDELVNELIEKVGTGEVGITDAYSYIENKLKGLTLGAHAFGTEGDGSTETIRFSYADDKYTLAQVVTDVTIKDNRIDTEIVANDCEVSYGYSVADLIAASGATVNAEGAAIDVKIDTKDLYMHAGSHEITLFFAGDEKYQPAKVTINVTVNKATVSVNYDSQQIVYGDGYSFALSIAPGYHNDGTKVNPELIEFMIGFDAHALLTFDPAEKNDLAIDGIVGMDQAIAFIQLRLPESIRELPLVGEYLQGEFTLSQFTDLINQLSDSLGIDEESMEILNQVVEAITGVTDRMDVKVIISDKEFHPTNMGVYVAGAVTIDSDYETAYTADYLIIAPKTTEVELEWNTPIENYNVLLPQWNMMDKGASVVGDPVKDFAIKTFIFGVNTDDSGILSTDIYGNIKANLWMDPEEVKDNGAYVQIALGAKWGNELYYAVPIVRAFAILPAAIEVELVGADGTPNNELLKEFNNQPQGFSVIVKDNEGNIIYSDHYQNVVALPENAQIVVRYIGVQSNGKLYNSTEKPVHAGVYTVYAIYVENNADDKIIDLDDILEGKEEFKIEDLYELFDLQNIGADAGLLVIEPAKSTIDVENAIVTFNGTSYDPKGQVTATSQADASLNIDKTIIIAGIGSDGTFTDNAWSAVNGSVNIDFPRWVDEILKEYAPSILNDGITVDKLADKLTTKLPEITAALEAEGATSEVLTSLENAIDNVVKMLNEMPDNTKVSFTNKYEIPTVGAYLIGAVVTDSDHYPSADVGYVIITPEFNQVALKWNYEDENGIFTRDLLEHIDLWATAYDVENGDVDVIATRKITYQFIGVNANGEIVIYSNPTDLYNGAFIEIAYIELELNGVMYVSDLIARPVVITPSNCTVEIEELRTEFDNTEKNVTVNVYDLDGRVIDVANGELTFVYAGLQTNGQAYLSDKAPVHAGVYEVIAVYVEYDENGEMRYYGAGVSGVMIDMAESNIDVNGGTVEYNGEGHTADVTSESEVAGLRPDYTLISGGAYITGDINTAGINAFHSNVNIDFPRWFDAVIADTEAFQNGVTPAYLSRFINSYRDEVVADAVDALSKFDVSIDDKMNAYIDELLYVLEQMPADVTLTFVDNITYTEPGYYFYYGIVTDSDHYPSTDTGLLVIEQADGLVYDLLDTIVYYDGQGQMVTINNPENHEAINVIIDRENNVINIVFEENAQYIINKIAELLEFEFDGNAQISNIVENYAGREVADALVELINELEASGISEEVRKAFDAIKLELDKLPATGTILINGELPVNVGVYEVYAIAYSRLYKTVTSEAVLEIIPAEITITVGSTGKVYGESDPEFTYSVSIDNGYIPVEGLDVVISREEGNNVGEYVITADYNADKNYVVTVVDGAFTITPAELTITLDDAGKVYGEADPELTYTVEGLVNGDTVEDLNIVVNREAGEDYGTYKITAIASNSNYNINIIDATFSITKATVSVDVNDATKVYGDADPEFSAVVTGMQNGETLNLTFTREEGENVGEYIITATASDANYDIIFATGKLTITKATVSVDVNDATKVYGDADPAFSAKVEGLKFNDELNVTFTREEGENVGEYIITATASDANYDIIFAEGKLTITKKAATITADSLEKIYGKADPILTAKVIGAVNNENLVYSVERVAGENVGTYETYIVIDTESAVNANYDITVATGTLTITKAPLTVTLKDVTICVNAVPTFTWEITGLVNNDTESAITVNVTAGTDYTIAGTYTITATVDAANYVVKVEDATLTVNKHEMELVREVAADCITHGYAWYECSNDGCDYCENGETEFDLTNHNKDCGTRLEILEASCVKEGYEKTICKGCDTVIKTVIIPADSDAHAIYNCKCLLCEKVIHSYDAGVVTAPTCTEEGYTTYTCTVCAHSYTADKVVATGHTKKDAVVENNTAPTCTTKGSYDTVVYCDTCDAELDRTTTIVSATGHSYNVEVTDPTFEAQGYTTYTCTVCGDSFVDNYVPALVCTITVDGVKYESWADAAEAITAIAKGQTCEIVFYADITIDNYSFQHEPGTTYNFNLNGNNLTVESKLGCASQTTVNFIGEGKIVANGSVTLNADTKVTLAETVDFDGTLTFNGHATMGQLYIDGRCWIGLDGVFTVTDGALVLKLENSFKEIAITRGHLTLNEDLDTLKDQIISIKSNSTSAPSTVTIVDGVTLTLHPDTTIEIGRNGYVDGEGTIAVGTKAHLDLVLTKTEIKNIEILEGITIDEYTLDRDDVFYTGAKNLTGTGATITAGTFDYDVRANCVEGYVTHNNGNSTWTVVGAIAKIVNTESVTYYETVKDALDVAKSGDMVIMLANDNTNQLALVPSGVTLDLNGKILDASYFIGVNGSQVMDSVESATQRGRINANLKYVTFAKDNTYIPVMTDTGYLLAKPFTFHDGGKTPEYGDTTDLLFRPVTGSGYINSLFKDEKGMSDNGLSVVVRLTWLAPDGKNTRSQDFKYNDAMVSEVYSLGKGFTFRVSGLSKYKNMNLEILIISNTGVEYTLHEHDLSEYYVDSNQ